MIYVFDIDGTICFNGKVIDEQIVQAIKEIEEKGNQVIFASARPIRDLLPITTAFKQNQLIGGNGSILAEGVNITGTQSIPITVYQKIRELITEYGLDYIIDDTWNYAVMVKTENPILHQLDPGHLAQKVDVMDIESPIKIILLNIPITVYDEIVIALRELSEEITLVEHAHQHNLDITAAGINKHSALVSLIGDAEYIAFGNDSNDYEMLKKATSGYFVGDIQDAETLGLDTLKIIDKNISAVAKAIINASSKKA